MVTELLLGRALGPTALALALLSVPLALAQDGEGSPAPSTAGDTAPPETDGDTVPDGAVLEAPEPPPPPAAAAAILLVAVNVDGAQVAVGEEVVGTTPIAPLELPPGTHTVRVAAEGFTAFEETVTLAPGEDGRLDVRLSPESGALAILDRDEPDHHRREPMYKRWPFWAGVGGAGLITLVALVAVAASSGGSTPNPDGIPLPPINP